MADGCGVVAAAVLTLLLPNRWSLGPPWLLPIVEAALLVALVIGDPGQITRRSRELRMVSIALVAVMATSALSATVQLIHELIVGGAVTKSADELLSIGVVVWLGTVIAFALLFWELDAGGAAARAHHAGGAFIVTLPTATNAARHSSPESAFTSNLNV